MQSINSEFNYQSIIAVCGIQGENIKKVREEKNEAEATFYEKFQNYKTLVKEQNECNEMLSKRKLLKGKNLLKLQKTLKKMTDYNKECKIIQERTAKLVLEVQKQSDNFIKKIKKMDDELATLYSQFEGETVMDLVNNLNSELISCLDAESQLRRKYEQLEHFQKGAYTYKRFPYLKLIIPCASEAMNIESERKLANKKKNTQFLANEYNKKQEFMQKFVSKLVR